MNNESLRLELLKLLVQAGVPHDEWEKVANRLLATYVVENPERAEIMALRDRPSQPDVGSEREIQERWLSGVIANWSDPWQQAGASSRELASAILDELCGPQGVTLRNPANPLPDPQAFAKAVGAS